MESRSGRLVSRVLYAPLSWGLGHATRSIFFIRRLLEEGHEVVVAADGEAYVLLREAFPRVRMVRMPSCRIRYSRSLPAVWKILFSWPCLWRSAKREHRQVLTMVGEERFDRIISDHRYGVWHPDVRSELVIHQLWFRLPRGWRWLEPWLFRLHRRWLRPFDVLLVPDRREEPVLAGILSHPPQKYLRRLPPVEYVGVMSRFLLPEYRREAVPAVPYDVLVLLSGPEPQRTVLERLLVRRLRHGPEKVLVVRGLPGRRQGGSAGQHVRLVAHLPPPLFYTYLRTTPLIIARAGYTTIMDLVAVNRTALLIPTPGQTEQEYLAEHLEQQGMFLTLSQKQLQGREGTTLLRERLRELEKRTKKGDVTTPGEGS